MCEGTKISDFCFYYKKQTKKCVVGQTFSEEAAEASQVAIEKYDKNNSTDSFQIKLLADDTTCATCHTASSRHQKCCISIHERRILFRQLSSCQSRAFFDNLKRDPLFVEKVTMTYFYLFCCLDNILPSQNRKVRTLKHPSSSEMSSVVLKKHF